MIQNIQVSPTKGTYKGSKNQEIGNCSNKQIMDNLNNIQTMKEQYINRSFQMHTQILEPFFQSNITQTSETNFNDILEYYRLQRQQLVKMLLKKQINYIAYLKVINYRIKMPLQMELGVNKQDIEFMFGEINNFVKFHSIFVNKLSNLVDQFDLQDKEFPELIKSHIQCLIIYTEYINKNSNIIDLLQNICSQNKKAVIKLFMDFQQSLQYYISLPVSQITYYKTFLDAYIKNLPANHQNFLKFKAIQQVYKNIILYRLNLENQQTSQELTGFLMSNFSDFGQLQIIFQSEIIYRKQKCKLYVVRGQNKHTGICVLQENGFMQRVTNNIRSSLIHSSVTQYKKVFSIILAEQTYINQFSNTFYFPNRLAICNTQHFYMIQFEKPKNAKNMREKIRILQSGAVFKNKVDQYIYQGSIMSFSLVISLLGFKNNQINSNKAKQQKIVLKINNYRYQISQFIFITQQQLQKILNHLLSNSVYNLKDKDFQIDQIFKNLINKNYQVQQLKWIQLESVLNLIIRNKQFRKNSEYLFHKLKVFQGFWEILCFQSNNQDIQICGCAQCKINLKDIQPKILQLKVDGEWQFNKKICPKFWLKARNQLQQKLDQKSYTFEKKIIKNGFSQTQKLLLSYLQLGKIGWKLNKCYKTIRQNKKIMVKYFSIFGGTQQIQIWLEYSQETVQLIIKKICKTLQISSSRDFCLSNIIKQQRIEYDSHEFIMDILAQNNSKVELHFCKRFYFSQVVEQQLMEQQNNKMKKLGMIVSEIINKIKNYKSQIQLSIVKNYLFKILQILFYLKQVSKDQKIDKRYLATFLHPNSINLINQQTIQDIKKHLLWITQNKRQITDSYSQLISIFHRINKIDSMIINGTFIKPSILTSKVYETFQAILQLNYDGFVMEVQKLSSRLKLNHRSYKVELIGNILYFKRKNESKSEVIWVKVQKSYAFWSNMVIYQKMYTQTKNKNSTVF